MTNKTLVIVVLATAFALGMISSTFAAPNYGPTGLGSNLHRRFVMKQATKDAQQGKPVRRSAILWKAGPGSTAWRGR